MRDLSNILAKQRKSHSAEIHSNVFSDKLHLIRNEERIGRNVLTSRE